MKIIKAIDTIYKGYKFRSRLEARWAVFFDALGIDWDYELEGYILSDGKKYLPDFWLPTFEYRGMFVEVKPKGGDFSKAKLLSKDLGQQMWFAEGVPDYRAYEYFAYDGIIDGEIILSNAVGIPNNDQAWEENRMFINPGYENEDLSVNEDYLTPNVIKAVNAAKQAKFGERQ